jgi:hypothetical protein
MKEVLVVMIPYPDPNEMIKEKGRNVICVDIHISKTLDSSDNRKLWMLEYQMMCGI